MIKRLIASLVCFAFLFSNLQYVQAQEFNINQLPVPGTMVGVSAPFVPMSLKGLIVDPQKPLEFQFVVDTGSASNVILKEAGLTQEPLKQAINQLAKYFLAGLTIPEGDLWVNLSPYEKDRIVPEALGQTNLGRDLLAQDYILKQLTASLIYPEKGLGKEFWARVYAKAQAQFGTTNIPVNTFNKVWILPNQAQVYETPNAAYVTKATLKVMLDEDYLALQKHSAASTTNLRNATNSIGANIIRQIILPEIEKEVNTGKNFAQLRQIFQALILAKWYKEKIQNGLLETVYTNKKKIAGINSQNPANKEQIYQRYIQAYKIGVFNYIKEDSADLSLQGTFASRKYFSGGITKLPGRIDEDGAMAAVAITGRALIVRYILSRAKVAFMKTFRLQNYIDNMYASKITSESFREQVHGLVILGGLENRSAETTLHVYFMKREDSRYLRELAIYFAVFRAFVFKKADEYPSFYLKYFSHMAHDSSLQIRDIAKISLAVMIELQKIQIGDIHEQVLRAEVDNLRHAGPYLDRIVFHAHKVLKELTDFFVPDVLYDGSLPPVDEAYFTTNMNEYAKKPFLMEYLINASGETESPDMVAQRIEKLLNVPQEDEVLQAAAAALSNKNGSDAVIDALIRIILKKLVEINDDNSTTGLEVLMACAEALKTNGRPEFIKAIIDLPTSPTVQVIKTAMLSPIQERNHVRKDMLGLYRQALSGALSGIVAPLVKDTGAAKENTSHAMTHQDLAQVNLLNPVEAAKDGGIDLNQIKISSTGKTIIQFDPAQLVELTQDGDFGGFAPVIESITFIKSPLPLFQK